MQIKKFFRTKIIFPLSRLVLGGISPRKVAMALAVGFAVGCFPVIGPTTILCILVGWVFRLNIPAIQLGNYISTPLQLALLFPAYEYGGVLFGSAGKIPDFSAIFDMIKSKPLQGGLEILNSVWQAVVIWGLYAPFMFLLVYYLVRLILLKWKPAEEKESTFTLPDTVQ